ncbi:DUF742 domain-containing protein [Streptomyces sp. NPDC046909]|uniref:DUF742 domain-containing protein n=1 Tax=Streptomyces sp. NPDC046909 TaxID=3155617 RepID=UPI0033CEEBEA
MPASEMTDFNGPAWTSEDAEVPGLYVLTGGQSVPTHRLEVQTMLVAEDIGSVITLGPETQRAIEVCRGQPTSVAEIAALIEVPLQITKVVLSQLIDAGALTRVVSGSSAPAATSVMEAVLEGLRNLPVEPAAAR